MVNVGEWVSISDEQRVDHVALVTAIHGWTTEQQRAAHIESQRESAKRQLDQESIDQERYDSWIASLESLAQSPFQPSCINVVYVSLDVSKRDPYGQQLERMSSLTHESQMQNMTVPGRFYRL
jgi:hypothetical protein